MKKIKLNNNLAVTLMELIMGIVLLSFIMLAVTGIDISARKLLGSVDKETITLMDASIAMEHMAKWISLAIGDVSNTGVTVTRDVANDLDTITVRVDYNTAGQPLNTPRDYNDDTFREYAEVDNSLRYRIIDTLGRQISEETLARRVNDIDFEFNSTQNYVRIIMVARYDPSQAVGMDNPEVRLESNISPRCRSTN